MTWLSALSNGLAGVERWASRLLVVAFVALIAANVTTRYVFGRPIVYAEELAAILLVWLAFVATSITVHGRAQIGVTLLTERLSAPVRRIVDIVGMAVIAAMLVVLLWTSWHWARSPMVEFDQIITTGWPKAPFYLIVPIFCASALIHVVADLAEAITGRKSTGLADEGTAV